MTLDPPNTVKFVVFGRPQQRGSKRAVPLKTGKTVILDDNRKSRGWMQAIQAAAGEAMNGREIIRDPVVIYATFYFLRPKSHFGTGRNSKKIKSSSPRHHSQTPDLDKLLRSLLDGCTGTVITDDRLVSRIEADKCWTTGTEGMSVKIREMTRMD